MVVQVDALGVVHEVDAPYELPDNPPMAETSMIKAIAFAPVPIRGVTAIRNIAIRMIATPITFFPFIKKARYSGLELCSMLLVSIFDAILKGATRLLALKFVGEGLSHMRGDDARVQGVEQRYMVNDHLGVLMPYHMAEDRFAITHVPCGPTAAAARNSSL